MMVLACYDDSVPSKLTRLEAEILYTLWLSEINGNKDGLLYKDVHERTAIRCPCTLDSVKKCLQGLRNRHEPHPPVVPWEASEQDIGRRPNLWMLDPDHLVTLPLTAKILQLAHHWPHSCINAERFMGLLNDEQISDEMFLGRVEFMLGNEYLGSTKTSHELFYNTKVRTTAEIDYIRRIAAHLGIASTEAIPPVAYHPPMKDGWPVEEEDGAPEEGE